MNYSGIKYSDMINGKGIRVSLFVSGCTHKCKGCFNKDTWDPDYGNPFTEKEENEIFDYFKKYGSIARGLSLLGGDPTYYKNTETLINFLKKFRANFPDKDVWIWSGFTWEQIMSDKKRSELISLCDVLIDGKFMLEEKNLNLKWKGSNNQRVIDVQKSLATNSIVIYQ
ncbi:Anaerobic ribonucleoside-triphosphate reductase-activating protein [Fusobacterium sp. DD29]|uniref:anaerobic ribonucleoside-triphosphate reductase activating protein n=1 Tax=unclassified Fusobacterium TaxID=2648384 RepID=UPI001B8C0D71|nr:MULTISPECIES: anaerobic ribonucleoside-triphosphate reductase activating protein [unclassified Fusobacterium]MBR8701978.1 Anaerobic ribonucleoside-triphosphate reductase-activating protein [Fusobacterium sp. DD45]MBR8711779.1 Anaerobic ribonucleoside-triphosphate reductase-activating protein [Fusobacterium sp. DD28]MBR8749736.1 Anaerobic ribonucleoside-triphosphate reductase-activating protein [Fusobacterium sp. DD29]MBR8752341.1 Anaerobic ribonucleoside-triphosphate reductase-activating pro